MKLLNLSSAFCLLLVLSLWACQQDQEAPFLPNAQGQEVFGLKSSLSNQIPIATYNSALGLPTLTYPYSKLDEVLEDYYLDTFGETVTFLSAHLDYNPSETLLVLRGQRTDGIFTSTFIPLDYDSATGEYYVTESSNRDVVNCKKIGNCDGSCTYDRMPKDCKCTGSGTDMSGCKRRTVAGRIFKWLETHFDLGR